MSPARKEEDDSCMLAYDVASFFLCIGRKPAPTRSEAKRRCAGLIRAYAGDYQKDLGSVGKKKAICP